MMTLAKAKRSPFHWRLLKQEELVKHHDPRLQYGIFSKQWTHGLTHKKEIDRIEGYCGSEGTAAWLADKWNEDAALFLITEGTEAQKLIEL